MNLSKSPKATKSSKSPTTTKEGKDADPLAGIEDLVEDMPEKAPEAAESKKEEIIEDIDASSFDLNPEEETELAQALEKEAGGAKKSTEVPAEIPEKSPEETPEQPPQPEVVEGAQEPAGGTGAAGEGENYIVETEGEPVAQSTPAPETEPAQTSTAAEGAQPAEAGIAPPPLSEAASAPTGEEGKTEKPAPEAPKEVKFDTESPIANALDEKSFMKAQIEAALFVSDKPVSTEDLSIKLEARKTLCAEMIKELMMDYMDRVTSLEIVKVGDDTYTMQIRPEYSSKVKKFASGGLIPEGVMRTLTIIALKQPIAKSLLVKLRGSGAYEHVKDLEDRGLVKSERAGRTQNVTTTDQFADMFGLSRDVKKMILQLKAQLGVKEDDVKEDTTPKAPPPVPER